ncbi:MAG: DUF63 family protein [Candidatus Micrarchaeota archaeon]
MSLSDFFQEFFVKPIDDRTGYNTINTLAYALLALAAAYFIYRGFRKLKIKIDERFVISTIPFILLGSTARVVTDAIDRGVLQAHRDFLFGLTGALLDSHIYDYGYLTTTPGIYVVVGLITLASVLLCNKTKRMDLLPYIGLALWLPHFVILLPTMKFFAYLLVILALAVAGFLFGVAVLRLSKIKNYFSSGIVFSHALDGAATFVILNVFNPLEGKAFFEQHVLSRALGDAGSLLFGAYGMLLFYLVKVIFSTVAAVVVENDASNQEERNYIILLLMVFGLAPGVRDALTMLCGT